MKLRFLLIFALVSSTYGLDFRIVNGREGDIENFPYLAALMHRGVVRGGATIVNENTVITAAHCFKDIVLEKFFVRVGTDQAERLTGGQLIPVLKYIGHPNYNPLTQNNDIGIVWTKESFIFGKSVKPIAMAKRNAPVPIGKMGAASGWGRLAEKGPFPDKFHFALLPVLPTEKCIKKGGGGYDDFRITDKMFCAGYVKEGGTDACKADSGGPFVVDNKLVGVISFGQGCGRKKFPGVYTNVAVFRQWIDDNIEKDEKKTTLSESSKKRKNPNIDKKTSNKKKT